MDALLANMALGVPQPQCLSYGRTGATNFMTSPCSQPAAPVVNPKDVISQNNYSFILPDVGRRQHFPISNFQSSSAVEITGLASNMSTSQTLGAAEQPTPETEPRALSPFNLFSGLCRDLTQDPVRQTTPVQTNRLKPQKNSKHSQSEKYFCDQPGCKRSQTGHGFKRRDNLTQHVSQVHKRNLETRVRKPSAAASSFRNPPPATSSSRDPLYESLNPLSPPTSKKRRHEEDTDSEYPDGVPEQLAAERRTNQVLMRELASTRDELRRLRREREGLERQHREELEGWQDKYYALLDSSTSK
jgi:hypothetical protein